MTARSIFLAFSLCALNRPVVRADTLENVLTRVDQTAKDFKSFSAKWTHTDYQKILDDTTTTHSDVRMQRNKDGLTGLIEDTDGTVDYFEGHTAKIYHPKANQADVIDLGKKSNDLEQVILLGFGTRRADLEKNYSIKLGGADSIGGTQATRIELTPKSNDLKRSVTRIELWIPEGEGYPIQEKFSKPGGDYTLVTYSAMKMPAPPNTSFKLILPPDVHLNYPQK